jgi:hypothetical protein
MMANQAIITICNSGTEEWISEKAKQCLDRVAAKAGPAIELTCSLSEPLTLPPEIERLLMSWGTEKDDGH